MTGAHVTGVGNTRYAKRLEESVEVLAAQAVRAAAADGGIDVRDIDGIIAYPGQLAAEAVISLLGLPDVSFRAEVALGGASAVSGLGLAALAVAGGAARTVLLLRAIKGRSGPRKTQRPSLVPGGRLRAHLEAPAGLNTAAQRYALIYRRYLHEHGLDRAVPAEIALAARFHAGLNPDAQMHGRELTAEQYAAGRLIADPYTLYDCCLETDGACAVLVTGRPGGVRILGVSEGHADAPDDLLTRRDLLDVGLGRAAGRVWERTGLGPADMDAAMVYDCFTFEVVHQLVAAGFATPDTVADLVLRDGIRLGGRLPVNTHGGLLSEGHMAGLNHVVEATRQLRGSAGARQIDGARRIAVTGWGNLGDGSIAVLGADRA
jgi:acetyl-CoA acetyltransferase